MRQYNLRTHWLLTADVRVLSEFGQFCQTIWAVGEVRQIFCNTDFRILDVLIWAVDKKNEIELF